MAALQTLRNKPALLMSVIGGALLLFIVTLTDLNSCSRPNVEAEVNGQELTYENYEAQVRDEENVQSLLLDKMCIRDRAKASTIQTAVHEPASLTDTTCALRSMTSISKIKMATMKMMKPPRNRISLMSIIIFFRLSKAF